CAKVMYLEVKVHERKMRGMNVREGHVQDVNEDVTAEAARGKGEPKQMQRQMHVKLSCEVNLFVKMQAKRCHGRVQKTSELLCTKEEPRNIFIARHRCIKGEDITDTAKRQPAARPAAGPAAAKLWCHCLRSMSTVCIQHVALELPQQRLHTMNNPARRVNFFGCGLFLWSLVFVHVHVEVVEQRPPMHWVSQLLKDASPANLQAALQEVHFNHLSNATGCGPKMLSDKWIVVRQGCVRRKLAMLGFVVFGLCLATQLTFVKLHLSNSPPRTIAIHFELPVPRSIWDASAVLLMVLSLAVLLLAAFCHGSLGPLTTVACDRDRTERDLELRLRGRCLPLEEHPDVNIVTKETYLDSEDEELFKEVAVGLLIPSSPYLGFATTIERAPRLISACLPFTARGYWEQGLTFVQQKDLATGMALAILHLHYLSLVHCGIKPDNFLVDAEGTVFVIDFGSVSREGDVPPMMCNSYRPPDENVSRAWDIYSLGAHVYKHERHVAILHGMPPFCLVQCPVMRKYQSLQSLLAVSCSKVDFDIAQLWASTLVPRFCYSLSVADAGRYYGSAVLLPKRSALRPLAPVVSSAVNTGKDKADGKDEKGSMEEKTEAEKEQEQEETEERQGSKSHGWPRTWLIDVDIGG
ncbi:unnamed protein product, partial [Cladocopium goreaui]